MPADILLLSAPQQSAYIDTFAINGETTLKQKFVFSESLSPNSTEINMFEGQILCKDPNQSSYSTGSWTGLFIDKQFDQPPIKLNDQNLVHKGSRLKDTDWIVGIVVYVGNDTLISKN